MLSTQILQKGQQNNDIYVIRLSDLEWISIRWNINSRAFLSLANLIPLQQKALPVHTTIGIKRKHKQAESWKIFCSRKIFTALIQSTEIRQRPTSDDENALYPVESLIKQWLINATTNKPYISTLLKTDFTQPRSTMISYISVYTWERQVSAVADEPCDAEDALHHSKNVVNDGGRSVW